MTDEHEPPPDSKLTRTKEKWATEGRFLTGKITRPEDQRLPPGQHLTKDWPVLDLGVVPPVSRERWRLDVYGAVDKPVFWTFAEFSAQKQSQFVSDIHCVTTLVALRQPVGGAGDPRASRRLPAARRRPLRRPAFL